MKTGEVFWSQFEVEKARSCLKNSEGYVLAILTLNTNADPSAEEHAEAQQENYRVRWIADPLKRLLPHWQRSEVNGRWYWTEQAADRQTLAKSRPWTCPRLAEQPKRRPTRLNFVIKPRPEDYDGEGLEDIWSYLSSSR